MTGLEGSADGRFGAASVADGYRRHLQPVIFEPWAQRLIDFVGLAPGNVVLDVASGTGVVALSVHPRTGRRSARDAPRPSAPVARPARRSRSFHPDCASLSGRKLD